MDTGFVTMSDRTVASEIIVGENGDISQINFLKYKSDTKARDELPENGSVRARIYRHRRQRDRNPTAAVDVQEWRQNAQWRRQQQRYGRAEPDGSSLPTWPGGCRTRRSTRIAVR